MTPRMAARLPLARLLTAALAALLSGQARAQDVAPPPFITVEGRAAGELQPDAAHLEVGVESERASAAAATAEVARATQAVAEAIRTGGIEDKDVRTTGVGLVPVYPEDVLPQAGQARLPRSYRASTTIALAVRPPDRAGTVLAQLVDKGVTSIDEITFSATGEGSLRDALRGDAVRDARRKADLYVQALGLHLAGVAEITPEESAGPTPLTFTRAQKSIMVAPTPPIPLVPGPIRLQEAVRIRWSIAP